MPNNDFAIAYRNSEVSTPDDKSVRVKNIGELDFIPYLDPNIILVEPPSNHEFNVPDSLKKDEELLQRYLNTYLKLNQLELIRAIGKRLFAHRNGNDLAFDAKQRSNSRKNQLNVFILSNSLTNTGKSFVYDLLKNLGLAYTIPASNLSFKDLSQTLYAAIESLNRQNKRFPPIIILDYGYAVTKCRNSIPFAFADERIKYAQAHKIHIVVCNKRKEASSIIEISLNDISEKRYFVRKLDLNPLPCVFFNFNTRHFLPYVQSFVSGNRVMPIIILEDGSIRYDGTTLDQVDSSKIFSQKIFRQFFKPFTEKVDGDIDAYLDRHFQLPKSRKIADQPDSGIRVGDLFSNYSYNEETQKWEVDVSRPNVDIFDARILGEERKRICQISVQIDRRRGKKQQNDSYFP